MFTGPTRHYHRCYISAPFGIDLGALTVLLDERAIAWNWAATAAPGDLSPAIAIDRCDFLIAIFDGSRSDYRVMYEIGIAEGLRKPVLALATNKRVNPAVQSLFLVVEVGLRESGKLGFQLDAFLATPHEDIFERGHLKPPQHRSVLPRSEFPPTILSEPHSNLEKRVFDVIELAGGSAIVEPSNQDTKLRPDLLIWLAAQEPQLLDPAVIEIKRDASPAQARKVEAQLRQFMSVSGIKSGFLLTEREPPLSFRFKSPNVFWLSVDHFVALTTDGRLGWYVRDLRNRAAHGLM
ncbi:nucleoside 2-deoxyribosyltransferase [Xanthobacter versatilis]|uniref:nucleoside 2-deoxyribosyltransferase n=1 Tax=Xanthobacter autotrophicus (strain ATCC BAA-1158 / Py2) TaxID=78245 RepID=UPI00372C3EA0